MPDYRYPVSQGPDYAVASVLNGNTGASMVTRSGYSDSVINAGDRQDLWPVDGDLVYLDSPETMTIVSTSVDDVVGGTGAQTLLVSGLDANFQEQEEIVPMNNGVAVVTVNTYRRVLSMTVLTAGAGGSNAGEITATSTVSGHVQSIMRARDSISSDAHYTIPAGKVGVLRNVWLSSGRNDEALMTFTSKSVDSNVFLRLSNSFLYEGLESFEQLVVRIEEKTDIKIETEAITNNPRVASIYQLFLFNK